MPSTQSMAIDVLVAVEEVVTHQRHVRVRWDGEEHPGLGQQRLAVSVGADRPDLEGDEAVVLAVEGLDDAALAALAEHLEQLVAVAEEISHRRNAAAVRSRRAAPSWRSGR